MTRKNWVPEAVVGLFGSLIMLGFKNHDCAATTIAGIELLRRIGKNQFSLRPLRVKDQTAPTIWNAVLAA